MKLLWHTSNLSQHNILGKNENLLNPLIILSELWPMAIIWSHLTNLILSVQYLVH